MVEARTVGVPSGRHFRAMSTSGTEHLIERTYREGGTFQWVRETWKNAVEANATRIEFTIEWQAVENKGVYRRLIVDDGDGMDPEELVEFFNTFGGGGKPIGGPHENFGVGAKTSLLPWNHYGVVVISRVDGIDSMIWLNRDRDTGEYGLRLFDLEDDEGVIVWEPVVEPFDDSEEHGADWRSVMPEWVGSSGTAIVLLGNTPEEDTVLGDPGRDEQTTHGLAQYLNRRIWVLPPDMEVSVDSLPITDRTSWPRSRTEFTTKQSSARTRRVHGAKALILDPGNARGKLSAEGRVVLSDGTNVHWLLWEGDRPDRLNHAFTDGFIAAQYQQELYNFTIHSAHYRQFGIAEEAVRKRAWLIIEPPHRSAGSTSGVGVYPNSSRNQLLIQGGTRAGDQLPVADWGAEFSDNLPDEIAAAIRAARAGQEGGLNDESWRERLAERFGSRWKIPLIRVSRNGNTPVNPTSQGSTPKRRPKKSKRRNRSRNGGSGGRDGVANTGGRAGSSLGTPKKVAGGIPTYRWVTGNELETGIMAEWHPNDPMHPEGAVLLNADHPVIVEQIENWQSKYAPHLADQVRVEVQAVYGEVAVAKIAHSEHLRGLMPDAGDIDKMRTGRALTMSLLGLIAEESMIATRVGGKLGQRQRSGQPS